MIALSAKKNISFINKPNPNYMPYIEFFFKKISSKRNVKIY